MRRLIKLLLAVVLAICCGCRIPTPFGPLSWGDEERECLQSERETALRGQEQYRELNSLGAGKAWEADPLLQRGMQQNNAHIAGSNERLGQPPR